MSCEKPGSVTSSASGVAMLEPGRIRPPTYLRKVVPCSFSAAPQRSIASDSARRTRASSKGGRLVLKTTSRLESHGLSLDGDAVAQGLDKVVALRRRDAAELGHDAAALVGRHDRARRS